MKKYETSMRIYKSRHNMGVKAIAMAVLCLFLFNQTALAYPDTLAVQGLQNTETRDAILAEMQRRHDSETGGDEDLAQPGFDGEETDTGDYAAAQGSQVDFRKKITETYQDATVAILGGTGFLGGKYLESLWNRVGAQVSNVKALSRRSNNFTQPPATFQNKLSPVVGDHLNPEAIRETIEGSRVIIDTAGLAWQHPGLGLRPPDRRLTVEECVQNSMSAALIGILIKSDQRLVWSSTNAIDIILSRLGEENQKLLHDEIDRRARRYIERARQMAEGAVSSDIDLISLFVQKNLEDDPPAIFPIMKGKGSTVAYADQFSYAYSKLLGQRILELIAEEDGKDIVVVKISDVYGPGQPIGVEMCNADNPARRIQRMLAVLEGIRTGNYTLPEEGEHGFRQEGGIVRHLAWGDYVAPTYIDDVTEILFRASVVRLPAGKVVLETTAPWIPNVEMLEAARNASGVEVEIIPSQEHLEAPPWSGEGLQILGIGTQNLTPLDKGLRMQLVWHRAKGETQEQEDLAQADFDNAGGTAVTAGGALVGEHRGEASVNQQIGQALLLSIQKLRDEGRVKDMAGLQREVIQKILTGELDTMPHDRRPRIEDFIACEQEEADNGTNLTVVRLPVAELGKSKDGTPFTGHIGFRQGLIWVAAEREDPIDVELDIMHEIEEYNLAAREARDRGWTMEQMAQWRDGASHEAQMFFDDAHIRAWLMVYEKCDAELLNFEGSLPVRADIPGFARAELSRLENKKEKARNRLEQAQATQPGILESVTGGIAVVSSEEPQAEDEGMTADAIREALRDGNEEAVGFVLNDIRAAMESCGLSDSQREPVYYADARKYLRLFEEGDITLENLFALHRRLTGPQQTIWETMRSAQNLGKLIGVLRLWQLVHVYGNGAAILTDGMNAYLRGMAKQDAERLYANIGETLWSRGAFDEERAQVVAGLLGVDREQFRQFALDVNDRLEALTPEFQASVADATATIQGAVERVAERPEESPSVILGGFIAEEDFGAAAEFINDIENPSNAYELFWEALMFMSFDNELDVEGLNKIRTGIINSGLEPSKIPMLSFSMMAWLLRADPEGAGNRESRLSFARLCRGEDAVYAAAAAINCYTIERERHPDAVSLVASTSIGALDAFASDVNTRLASIIEDPANPYAHEMSILHENITGFEGATEKYSEILYELKRKHEASRGLIVQAGNEVVVPQEYLEEFGEEIIHELRLLRERGETTDIVVVPLEEARRMAQNGENADKRMIILRAEDADRITQTAARRTGNRLLVLENSNFLRLAPAIELARSILTDDSGAIDDFYYLLTEEELTPERRGQLRFLQIISITMPPADQDLIRSMHQLRQEFAQFIKSA